VLYYANNYSLERKHTYPIIYLRGRSQITSRKKNDFFDPTFPPLSQIFQRTKNFVFGLSQILLPPPPQKRDVICERPLIVAIVMAFYVIIYIQLISIILLITNFWIYITEGGEGVMKFSYKSNFLRGF